jgi:hypothetical protein
MKRKKLILSESSLIDLIASTVMEAMEDIHNPLETGKPNPKNQPPPNHYIDAEPDLGWDKFWLDFNGDDEWQDLGQVSKMLYGKTEGDKHLTKKYGGRMPLSDEEFLEEYKKSREDFKVDLRDEVVKAKRKAINYYKELYHPDNKTVVKKISKQKFAGQGEWTTKLILKNLQSRLDDIKNYKKHTLVHFSKKDVKKVGGQSPDAWGWVWVPVTGADVYNMNLYNFTRPGLGSWKEKIYSTTIHELGHIIDHLFDELGVEAYQEMDDQDIEFKDKDYNTARKRIGETTLDKDAWKALSHPEQKNWAKSLDLDVFLIGKILNHIAWEKYVQRDSESYARLQQLRRVFGFTRDTGSPSAKEWVNMWMEKVNNGEITIGNDEQIGRQLYIPRNPKEMVDLETGKGVKWGWHYTCKVQTFLLKHNYSVGSKERKNGKEVCDGGYGSATKKALRDFYKNMWKRSKSGTRVFITIPNEMVKWDLGVEKPRSYDEINDLTRTIFYNGEQKGDIASLLAKTAWDSGESGSKSGENYELVLDFNEIAYYNDIFVDTDSDLYLQYDDEDQGLEIDKTLRQT